LGEVKVWNTADWSLSATYQAHEDKVYALAFLNDNRTLISASEDSTLAVWDTGDSARKSPIRTVLAHSGAIWSVDVSPNGEQVATGGTDNTVNIWRVTELALQPPNPVRWSDYSRVLFDMAFADNGRLLCVGVLDGKTFVQDVRTGHIRHVFSDSAPKDVFYIDINDRRRILAAGRNPIKAGEPNRVVAYDFDTGETRWTHLTPNAATGLAFDAQGDRLAVCTPVGLRIVDAENGTLVREVTFVHKGLFRVRFSPNGRWLACTGLSGTHLIDAVKYAKVATLESDNFYTFAVDFSPDSSHLATGGADGVIKIWDVETSSLVRQCIGHAARWQSAAFLRQRPLGAHMGSAKYGMLAHVNGAQWLGFSGPMVARRHNGSVVQRGSERHFEA
jgi:WD40 repeat protein